MENYYKYGNQVDLPWGRWNLKEKEQDTFLEYHDHHPSATDNINEVFS